MLWSDWTTALASLLQFSLIDATSATPYGETGVNQILPRAIEYTEHRLQRDLDILAGYVTDNSKTLTANSRVFTLPVDKGEYDILTQASVIVAGQRQPPMTPVSREFLDASYPSDTATTTPSIPIYWCPVDQVSILVGPAPDSAYTVEVVGTQRFTPLSSTNTSNFLTLQTPDLYLAASMVFMCGFQRDYGSQSDDPHSAVSWESQYQTLLSALNIQEFRKKFQSVGWTSRTPSPVAKPPQT